MTPSLVKLRSALPLLLVCQVVDAQQPPDVVQSDVLGNTAMGFNAMFSNAGGSYNTAAGYDAMSLNTTGGQNVAFGYAALNRNNGNRNSALGDDALYFNLAGYSNSAVGMVSLYSNLTGYSNVGVGDSALYNNTSGDYNTAIGVLALQSNTTASLNTAIGAVALYSNSTGFHNSAVGTQALYSNTVGNDNMAFGYYALYANTVGSNNTAVGTYALANATSGINNNASGYGALYNNTTGNSNAAIGLDALYNNTTGSRNIGIGQEAGYYSSTGSYNIYISNYGNAADNGVIRIGDPNYHTSTYIAGISTTNILNGVNVVVNANGQLGVMTSSRRYKEDIQPMGDASARLLNLRPVTFRYKKPNDDGAKPVQYGLIAEEVAEVFPELVVYNEDGRPETVAYQLLAPLLVNELQKEHALNTAHTDQLAAQAFQLNELKQQFAKLQELNRKMQVALAELQARETRVARR